MRGNRKVLAFLLALPLLLSTAPSAFAGGQTVCDGSLPPGTYQSIVVSADDTCDLGVGPVTVHGGVRVEQGATFMLGYEGGPSTGTISGGVVADNAAQVQVHNAIINGGVTIEGGAGPFGCAVPYGPLCFTDFEDNSINGAVTISGYNGFWLGFIRNHVSGTVTISNNNQQNDEIDIGSLVVHGSLMCSGNNPLENVGESPGGPSTVTGQDTCNGT